MDTTRTRKAALHRTPVIAVKGAGEMASAIAWRLFMANMRRIYMMERPHPLAVRRGVSFCEALHERVKTVEGVTATAVSNPDQISQAWEKNHIAVLADPQWQALNRCPADVCVDAILAKKNLGTSFADAGSKVIGVGPGFRAGIDVHLVVESRRGHDLGRIITEGSAAENTGMPGDIGGYTLERVLRAPADGLFKTARSIGDRVKKGDEVGRVEGAVVRAQIDGVIRGLIRSPVRVHKGLKLGDVDPRGIAAYCSTISDKARAVAGAVLEAVLR